MNKEEVLAMLREIIASNQEYTTWTVSTPHLVLLVNKAVEAEREACAKLVDYWEAREGEHADAIRARSNT